MKELIPMTDFVLEYAKSNLDDYDFSKLVCQYAKFLKQPLELGMFVPCADGVPIEKPIIKSSEQNKDKLKEFKRLKDQHKQAKERVLFEGLYNSHNTNDFNTQIALKHKKGFRQIILDEYDVEGLLTLGIEITLTPNALKQIGL